MPRGNGTGPLGQGPGTGRGLGRGQGKISGNRVPGKGPGGYCICPQCGQKTAHRPGVPCTSITCPKCSSPMTRE